MEGYTVVIVDGDAGARERLRERLRSHPDFTVAGEAENGGDALAQILLTRPDFAVVDHDVPGLSAHELIKEALAEYSRTKIVVCGDVAAGSAALAAGATAAARKSDTLDEVIGTLEKLRD